MSLGHGVNLEQALAAAELSDGEGHALVVCVLKSLQLSSLQMLKKGTPSVEQ